MGYYMAGDAEQERMEREGRARHAAGRPTLVKDHATPPHDEPEGERRYRRMNVGNIRALRRSMRRVQAFAKLAHKTISFTKRVKMKKHRRH